MPEEDKETYLNDDNTEFNMDRVSEALLEVLANRGLKEDKVTKKNVLQRVCKLSLWEKLPEESPERVLAEAVRLIEQTKQLKRDITAREKVLHELTKTTIETLSDEQVRMLLHLKWVEPLYEQLLSMPDTIVDSLSAKVNGLVTKYETGLVEVERQITDASNGLSKMLDDLTGSKFDIQAYKELEKLLKPQNDDIE
jgi:type I restriction enzyme M protein